MTAPSVTDSAKSGSGRSSSPLSTRTRHVEHRARPPHTDACGTLLRRLISSQSRPKFTLQREGSSRARWFDDYNEQNAQVTCDELVWRHPFQIGGLEFSIERAFTALETSLVILALCDKMITCAYAASRKLVQ